METGKQYDEEFKKQAILLAKEIENSAAAKELGIPKGTWIDIEEMELEDDFYVDGIEEANETTGPFALLSGKRKCSSEPSVIIMGKLSTEKEKAVQRVILRTAVLLFTNRDRCYPAYLHHWKL